jgi:transposase
MLPDQALDRLNLTFCKLYAAEGRPSVPPEKLLLASLLQAFNGICSEQLLLEQLNSMAPQHIHQDQGTAAQ